MSVPVALAELAERVGEFGRVAYLVSVGAEGLPHVVSVAVTWADADLVVGAGSRTSANVELHPDVTLLWPARPGAGYSLIVDGPSRLTPGENGATLAITPTRAVLHRTPEGDPSAPSCVTVL